MLENFADEMETIKLINISYAKNEYGEMVETKTITDIEALVTNGTARATIASGGVEFIDYLKVHYDTGELKEGDKVEIKGIEYNVAKNPKIYGSHKRVEVVNIV